MVESSTGGIAGRICHICKRATSWMLPRCEHCGMSLFTPAKAW